MQDPFESSGGGRALETLPDFATEAAFSAWVLAALEPWFEIREQIRGTHCSGKRVRLDAALRPKDPGRWHDGPRTTIGVEFKRPEGGDLKYTMKWFAQCVDYTHVQWDGLGRLPVVACPGLKVDYLDGQGAFVIRHMMGQFRIGELVKLRRYGWSVMMHGHHRLWSERGYDGGPGGICEASRWKLMPPVGSR